MNWGAISAVADLLASVGVIASLIYVAIQLKLNSQSVNTSNYQDNMHHIASNSTSLAENPELADIWLRGQQSFHQLNDSEKVRFHMTISNFIIPLQMNLQLRDRGLMDASVAEGMSDNLLEIFRSPGAIEWWEASHNWFHTDFGTELDALIKKLQSSGQL